MRYKVAIYCSLADRNLSYKGRFYSSQLDLIAECLEFDGCVVRYFYIFLEKEFWRYGRWTFPLPFINLPLRAFKKIAAKLFSINLKVNVFSLYLKIFKPNIILGIDLPPSLCEAAHDQGVIVYEILHGSVNADRFSHWSGVSEKMRPNYVLFHNNRQQPILEQLNMKALHFLSPLALQNEFIKRKNLDYGANIANAQFDKEVLIALQWGYDDREKVLPEFKGILKNGLFFEEFFKLIEHRQDILWRFRLHPVQTQSSNYSRHANMLSALEGRFANVDWMNSSHLPLSVILQRCSGVITMSSSVAYDAAELGLNSLLICPTLRRGKGNLLFDDLVKSGFAKKEEFDVKIVSDWLDSLSHKGENSEAFDENRFCGLLQKLQSHRSVSYD